MAFREIDNFEKVKSKAARLRQEVTAGRLDKAQFKEQLRELMIQGPQGTWSMVDTHAR